MGLTEMSIQNFVFIQLVVKLNLQMKLQYKILVTLCDLSHKEGPMFYHRRLLYLLLQENPSILTCHVFHQSSWQDLLLNTMITRKLLMQSSVCYSDYENHLLLCKNILTIVPAGCVIVTLPIEKLLLPQNSLQKFVFSFMLLFIMVAQNSSGTLNFKLRF